MPSSSPNSTPALSDINETEKQSIGVVINEIITSNSGGLLDSDGDSSDWVEIYNSGETSVALKGYGLTDDSAVPYKSGQSLYVELGFV